MSAKFATYSQSFTTTSFTKIMCSIKAFFTPFSSWFPKVSVISFPLISRLSFSFSRITLPFPFSGTTVIRQLQMLFALVKLTHCFFLKRSLCFHARVTVLPIFFSWKGPSFNPNLCSQGQRRCSINIGWLNKSCLVSVSRSQWINPRTIMTGSNKENGVSIKVIL